MYLDAHCTWFSSKWLLSRAPQHLILSTFSGETKISYSDWVSASFQFAFCEKAKTVYFIIQKGFCFSPFTYYLSEIRVLNHILIFLQRHNPFTRIWLYAYEQEVELTDTPHWLMVDKQTWSGKKAESSPLRKSWTYKIISEIWTLFSCLFWSNLLGV